MAGRRGASAPEVTDEFEGMEFDDAGVEDITPVVEVPEVEDLGVEEVEVPPVPAAPDQLATTESFFGGVPNTPAGIEDLGVQVVEPDAETFEVAVTEDIGPVFYGDKIIEMKKGHRYRVTNSVYEYLYSRGKLVGQ